MLLDSYKEFKLAEKVRVNKDVIYSFLIANLGTFGALKVPVIDYVIRQKNQLSIAEIEYNPNQLIETYFSFYECEGQLYYGQFTKCFPTFYIMNPTDFKD